MKQEFKGPVESWAEIDYDPQKIPDWMNENICLHLLSHPWPTIDVTYSWISIFNYLKKPWDVVFDHWGTQEIDEYECLVTHPYMTKEKAEVQAKKFSDVFLLSYEIFELETGLVKIIFGRLAYEAPKTRMRSSETMIPIIQHWIDSDI